MGKRDSKSLPPLTPHLAETSAGTKRPKKFSLEWYKARVHKVITSPEPHRSLNKKILALLKDNRLRAFHDQARRRFINLSNLSAECMKDPRQLHAYNCAQQAFSESPRQKLIIFVKELPLAQKFGLAMKNAEVRTWLREELLGIDNKKKSDDETQARINAFIQNNSDLPFPVPGLPIRFSPDNGRIRMDLPVTADSNFREGFKKKRLYEYLIRWRSCLLEIQPPEPSRREVVLKDMYRDSQAGGGPKSYADMCNDLTQELYKRLEGRQEPSAAAVMLLIELGGRKELAAKNECKDIIAKMKSNQSLPLSIFSRDRIIYLLNTYGTILQENNPV